jgi:hypothetical protein
MVTFLSHGNRNQIRSVCRNPNLANKMMRGLLGDSHASFTLTADTTLTKATHFTHRIIKFDPGGAARVLTLPTEAEMDGFFGVLVNAADADEALTVKEDAGSTTIATIEQNEALLLCCDGTNWWGILLTPSSIT